jgi:hypothetical protein
VANIMGNLGDIWWLGSRISATMRPWLTNPGTASAGPCTTGGWSGSIVAPKTPTGATSNAAPAATGYPSVAVLDSTGAPAPTGKATSTAKSASNTTAVPITRTPGAGEHQQPRPRAALGRRHLATATKPRRSEHDRVRPAAGEFWTIFTPGMAGGFAPSSGDSTRLRLAPGIGCALNAARTRDLLLG